MDDEMMRFQSKPTAASSLDINFSRSLENIVWARFFRRENYS
jgi:hypothetical protein